MGPCLIPLIEPVAEKVPAAGSYNSAEERVPESLAPPAINTLPFGSNVAECLNLHTLIEPVTVNIPVAVSYKSAEEVDVPPISPPTAKTFPLGNNVSVY